MAISILRSCLEDALKVYCKAFKDYLGNVAFANIRRIDGTFLACFDCLSVWCLDIERRLKRCSISVVDGTAHRFRLLCVIECDLKFRQTSAESEEIACEELF